MCNTATTGTARATSHIENGRARVTTWHFDERGSNTGWHTHAYDYVVVPMFDGFLDIKDADGTITRAPMHLGQPYFRQRGVSHDVISANDTACSFVEIELLENPS